MTTIRVKHSRRVAEKKKEKKWNNTSKKKLQKVKLPVVGDALGDGPPLSPHWQTRNGVSCYRRARVCSSSLDFLSSN